MIWLHLQSHIITLANRLWLLQSYRSLIVSIVWAQTDLTWPSYKMTWNFRVTSTFTAHLFHVQWRTMPSIPVVERSCPNFQEQHLWQKMTLNRDDRLFCIYTLTTFEYAWKPLTCIILSLNGHIFIQNILKNFQLFVPFAGTCRRVGDFCIMFYYIISLLRVELTPFYD